MYGDEASKLAREAKRTIDHFPPYNDSLVRSITREVKHLHETCQVLIREFRILEAQLREEAELLMASSSTTTAAVAAAASSSSSATTFGEPTTAGSSNHPPEESTLVPSSLTSSSSSALRSEAQLRAEMQRQTQIFWTKYLVHYIPMQRNKRILMAYHHQRLEKIKEIAWAFNTLPEDTLLQTTSSTGMGAAGSASGSGSRMSAAGGSTSGGGAGTARLLSPDERVFFDEYERNRNRYLSQFGEIELGLGLMAHPPKDVFITVRVLRDCGDIVTESGATLSLKKNSEHFVKRSDVEGLITQGYLLHVA
ncbi:DNA replication protein psf1 [Actinomortierella ambigua]|uniref:DNA replication complex GINS protein PSF1 n=1 Tax=Actinomortierella ambigua TaxID=1343610 RepID=A0A9P6U8B8_9FUNG|nr:DNA replication protein psf1 [Actinomortierella ambigua]